MNLGVMQPYFFPYIGYWQLISIVDKFVVYDDVNYINRGWVNRNRILINGEPKFINLHLHNSSQNKLINEIQVSKEPAFKIKLLKTLENNYKRAPYFETVYPLIKNLILNPEMNLSRYLETSIKEICGYLEIGTEIIRSSAIKKNNSLRGQDKIIEICNNLKTETYINSIGGLSLYSNETFENNNLTLFFLKPGIPEYTQFNNEFISGLSIIDVLMFNSIEQVKEMLNNYELVKNG
ncbi:MAG: WbqC family protein [Solirubrobacterales bacterium]